MVNDVRSLLGRVGVWSMELRDAGRPQVQDAAAELDALGLRALWFPGLDGHGVFDDVGHLLRSAPNSAVVVGVLGIWGQDPTAIGDRLHQLDTEFGPRTITGFGVSNDAGGGERRPSLRKPDRRGRGVPRPPGRGRPPSPARAATAGGERSEDGRAGSVAARQGYTRFSSHRSTA